MGRGFAVVPTCGCSRATLTSPPQHIAPARWRVACGDDAVGGGADGARRDQTSRSSCPRDRRVMLWRGDVYLIYTHLTSPCGTPQGAHRGWRQLACASPQSVLRSTSTSPLLRPPSPACRGCSTLPCLPHTRRSGVPLEPVASHVAHSASSRRGRGIASLSWLPCLPHVQMSAPPLSSCQQRPTPLYLTKTALTPLL